MRRHVRSKGRSDSCTTWGQDGNATREEGNTIAQRIGARDRDMDTVARGKWLDALRDVKDVHRARKACAIACCRRDTNEQARCMGQQRVER